MTESNPTAAAASSAQGTSAATQPLLGKERLTAHCLSPLQLETPAALLATQITPVHLLFVRNHGPEPDVATSPRLRVSGAVQNSLDISLEELRRSSSVTVTTVLECAGNGRLFHEPAATGIQWSRGAVGNVSFTGTPLCDLLIRAGLTDEGKHVAFVGRDRFTSSRPFIRSIPITKAMHHDTILATHMNGQPLTLHHGAPLRVVVPGWLGAASVKWLEEVIALPDEYDGEYMKVAYRIPTPDAPGQTSAITAIPVKSIITEPPANSRVPLASVRISGAAWSGENGIRSVDISTDDGRTWNAATLGVEGSKYEWRLWHFDWRPTSTGVHYLLSRATDYDQQRQPMRAPWNPDGYLWNGCDRVRVTVF